MDVTAFQVGHFADTFSFLRPKRRTLHVYVKLQRMSCASLLLAVACEMNVSFLEMDQLICFHSTLKQSV